METVHHMPNWLKRLWIIPSIMLLVATGLFGYARWADIYNTFINKTPLLSYADTTDEHDSGMPTDKYVYNPGDPVFLTIRREVRENNSHLTNRVFISQTGEPRGLLVNTLSSTVNSGYSERTVQAAIIPPELPPGLYCLAGMQLVETKYGSMSVPWRSTWFYVVPKEAQ